MIQRMQLPSGRRLVRFTELVEIFEYDAPKYQTIGLGHFRALRSMTVSSESEQQEKIILSDYFSNRFVMTPRKKNLMDRAKKEMFLDVDFQRLVYEAKSTKTELHHNKFGGNLNIPAFAKQEKKIFTKRQVGKASRTIDIAFQSGMFTDTNFVKIIKLVRMCQEMNIHVNIDAFDSDTGALSGGYVIVRVISSHEKLDFNKLLACSFNTFFNFTLFNGYTGYFENPFTRESREILKNIHAFQPTENILEDLSPKYDIILGVTGGIDRENLDSDVVNILQILNF